MQAQEKIPVKSENTASRIVDGEAVIVVLDKQQTIVLNELGSRIWELVDGQKNIAELTQLITSEFDITSAEALKDINDFMEDLMQREVILMK